MFNHSTFFSEQPKGTTEQMTACVARVKGTQRWSNVTLGGQSFFASEGLLKDLMEAMAKKHPNAEFRAVPAR